MTATTNQPIFLVGFMGAGKTTVGNALARRLSRDFFDLDQLIETSVGKTVAEIFHDLGEPEFRRLEREAINRCRNLNNAVIALGGGAYASEENRAVLRALGRTVWLDCPLEVCLARVNGDQSRPLLADEAQMAALLEQRRPAYEQADYVLRTGDMSPGELASEIARLCGVQKLL